MTVLPRVAFQRLSESDFVGFAMRVLWSAILLAWVFSRSLQGASDHWAYRPLQSPPVPEVQGGIAPRNEIDSFILARLRKEGLEPSPEAGRLTLLRRLCFDLTGLPPTPAETAEFLADARSDAYERLVDRLLASPRYGERWARHWLDVVHYGETHGYDKDQPRPNAWPYRDYVIRAFNADRPYGRFIREQVAGDILWPDTEDGIAATGFISAGPWDFIGHAEVPETKTDGKIARLMDRDDMVANVMNTFNSTTIQCARCHDHKFDPVPMEDYYRLTAVFAALDRADRKFDTDPAMAARRRELESRKAGLSAEKTEIDGRFAKAGGVQLQVLEKLIASGDAGGAEPTRSEFGWHSSIEARQDVMKWVQVDLGSSKEIRRVAYAACSDDFNGIGDGFGFPLRYRVEASDDATFASNVRVLEDHTAEDFRNPGITPRSVVVETVTARYVRITATKLALRQNDYIFALAELEVSDGEGRNVALGAPVTASDSIEAAPRWGRANLTDGWFPGRKAPHSGESLVALKRWREQVLATAGDADLRKRRDELSVALANVQRELKALPEQRAVYAGMVYRGSGAFRGTGPDGGKPRPIHVLARGDVRKPGKEVGPGAPRSLAMATASEVAADLPEGARRVALAEWLAASENALTWRSIVNRVWQYHFGRALVDSPNDFGRMGSLPSHPELLDWMAVWFRDNGQSLKALHRLIVTSRTYRQVSTISGPDENPAVARDADNRLLWRMNRRKLEAEAVRDSILAVAGRLDPAIGGPSFRDFVLERPEHSPHYEYRFFDPEDPRSHRRSIYRFLVRSQPQPLMTALDCADPSISVDRRNETLNALQALALMNNPLGVAMAKHFAARLEREATGLNARIDLGFRLVVGRPPTADESQTVVDHARNHGLASACRLLFNLNEFVFVD